MRGMRRKKGVGARGIRDKQGHMSKGIRTRLCASRSACQSVSSTNNNKLMAFSILRAMLAHSRREHDSDGGWEPPGLFSAQVTGQATEMHTLRMQLLAEMQRRDSSTAPAMPAVEAAARKVLAAAKRIAGADQKRSITAAQHQQVVREVKAAGQVTSLDAPYFNAIGRILVSGPQDSLAASPGGARGRWGDGKVSDAALETILEANCAIMASVCERERASVCVCFESQRERCGKKQVERGGEMGGKSKLGARQVPTLSVDPHSVHQVLTHFELDKARTAARAPVGALYHVCIMSVCVALAGAF